MPENADAKILKSDLEKEIIKIEGVPRFSKGSNRAGRSPHPTSKFMALGTIEEATSENANSYPEKNSNHDTTSNKLR